jgi:lipopolysaccharide export system permease protein
MPSLLTRHIVAESYRMTAAVSGILVMVYLSNQLARYLAQVAEGRLAGDLLLSLLVLKLASVLVLLLPAAFFLALLLVLGRMYSDSEMVALAACGYGPGNLLRTVMVAALPVGLLTAVLAFDSGPAAAGLADRVLKQARTRALTSAIVPGQFTAAGDNLVYHVQEVAPDGDMTGMFARLKRPDGTTLINADRARIEHDPASGRQDLVLWDGTRYDGTPGQGDYRVFAFERYRLQLPDTKAASTSWRTDAIPTGELLASDNRRHRAELHWRLALPLTVLVLAFLAVPISHSQPRQGRYARLLLALLAYVVYVNLLGAGRTLIGSGKIVPWVGLWWAHLPPLLLAWLLLRRQLALPWLPGRRAEAA